MRETKRRMELFSFYDHTGIRRHLEKMAAKGWMLEGISRFWWKYRRIEPEKLGFAVTYFPKASDFDPYPSEEQRTLLDYCEEAGWSLVTTTAQMQIFCSREKEPPPIETEAAVQVENIHRAMKKNYLIAHAVLLLLSVIQIGLLLRSLLTGPLEVLSSTSSCSPAFAGWCCSCSAAVSL